MSPLKIMILLYFGGKNVEEIMDQGMAHEDAVVCLNFAQLLFSKHKKFNYGIII